MDSAIDKMLEKAVAQVCFQCGFSSTQMGAFHILKDITLRYLKRTIYLTKSYAEHSNRAYPMISDVLMTFHHMGVSGSEMVEFLYELGDLMPYNGLVTAGPVGLPLDLSKPDESHAELESRPSFIPKHLPLLKRDEPIEAAESIPQSAEVSEVDEAVNSSKRLPTTQRTEYEAAACTHQISCVSIDPITGELVPLSNRQGKLPDLKLLANLKNYRRPSPQKKKKPLSPRINDLNTTANVVVDESGVVDENMPASESMKTDSNITLPTKSQSLVLPPVSTAPPVNQTISDAQWSAALLATPVSQPTPRLPQIFQVPSETSLAASTSETLSASLLIPSVNKSATTKKRKSFIGSTNRKRPPPKSTSKKPTEKRIKLETKISSFPKLKHTSIPSQTKKKPTAKPKSPNRSPLTVITSFGSDKTFTSSADTKDSNSPTLLGRQDIGDGIVRSPRRRKPSLIAVEAILDKELTRSSPNKKQCKTPPTNKTPISSVGTTAAKLRKRALGNNPTVINTNLDNTKKSQPIKVKIKTKAKSKNSSPKKSPSKSPKPKAQIPKSAQASPTKSTIVSPPITLPRKKSLELDSGEETDPMINDESQEELNVNTLAHTVTNDQTFSANINKGSGIRLTIKLGSGPNPENTSSLTGNETPSTPRTPPMQQSNLSPDLSVDDNIDNNSKSDDRMDDSVPVDMPDITAASKTTSHNMGPPLVTKILLGPTMSIAPASRPPELHKLTPLNLSTPKRLKSQTDSAPPTFESLKRLESTSSRHSESSAASPSSSVSSLDGTSNVASPVKVEKLDRLTSLEYNNNSGPPKVGELSPLNTPSSSFNGEPFKSDLGGMTPPRLADLSCVENQDNSPLNKTSSQNNPDSELNETFVPFITSTIIKSSKSNTNKKKRRASYNSKKKRPVIKRPVMRVDSVFSDFDTTLNDSVSSNVVKEPPPAVKSGGKSKKAPSKSTKQRKPSPVRSNASVKSASPVKYKPGTSHYYSNDKEKVWLCPVCGMAENGNWMIGCDSCDDWYHGLCLNMITEPDEEHWFCSHCISNRSKDPPSKKTSSNKKSTKSTGKSQSTKRRPPRKR